MDEKTKSENGKPILSKANKVSILILAIFLSIVFAFNLYLEFHRQIMCSQVAFINSQIPPSDMNDYLVRRILFRKVCAESSGLGSYFLAFASFGFLVYAINLFRKNPN